MAAASYRGFTLTTVGESTETWQVTIKKHTLTGSMAAVKKSIDWFCDTATLIDPKEFSAINSKAKEEGKPAQEDATYGRYRPSASDQRWQFMECRLGVPRRP